jgi:hypothetical protein
VGHPPWPAVVLALVVGAGTASGIIVAGRQGSGLPGAPSFPSVKRQESTR